ASAIAAPHAQQKRARAGFSSPHVGQAGIPQSLRRSTVTAQGRAVATASFVRMDEARAVLARLDRIEELEREGAPPGVLLEELRGLVQEAEAWARLEGNERART